ncbi:hypothetical protein [Aureispira anguillae]|uniref:Uncharacterized protein n=1 Tax=Aureispira anguillae TaxID=2864201 RepID=A0A915YLG6_9BACT|nr:hypothetical protein [Aureispira anguillae]BDS15121.1 hypothetical protein AsAng_0059050 [Aureispira anguillae]
MKYNYETLEDLLLHKNFEELNPQEQQFVQQLMSIEMYQQQRAVLLNSKRIFAEPSSFPPNNNLSALQAQFKAQHQRRWMSYLGQPIAAYQAAILAILVGIGVYCLRPITVNTTIQKEIVYVPQVDTVVQEKIILQEKVIYKTKTIQLPAPPPDTVYVPILDKNQFYQNKEDRQIFAKENAKSKSMKEMGALMDFVVGTE